MRVEAIFIKEKSVNKRSINLTTAEQSEGIRLNNEITREINPLALKNVAINPLGHKAQQDKFGPPVGEKAAAVKVSLPEQQPGANPNGLVLGQPEEARPGLIADKQPETRYRNHV